MCILLCIMRSVLLFIRFSQSFSVFGIRNNVELNEMAYFITSVTRTELLKKYIVQEKLSIKFSGKKAFSVNA